MLDHIISLDLSNNKVFELPDSFGDLVDLKKLNLYQNGLTKLPHTFAQLTQLRWLNLAGNSLKVPPPPRPSPAQPRAAPPRSPGLPVRPFSVHSPGPNKVESAFEFSSTPRNFRKS